VSTHHHVGIKMTAEELNRNKEMVRQILTINLNMKEVCAKWSQRICQILARKQIPTLTFHTHQILPCMTFLFS